MWTPAWKGTARWTPARVPHGLAIATRGFELIPPPSGSTFSAGDAGGPTVINNRRTRHGWWVGARGSLMLGVAGALVAVVVWRLAYRRTASA